MFTGIVASVGTIRAVTSVPAGARIVIDAGGLELGDVAIGDSIAVNGVCLTVNSVDGSVFEVNLIPHTLQTTNLGALVVGAKVNLEVDMVARYVGRLVEASR